MTDLTFSNPNIALFFQGKNNSPPTYELLYIHTHPMVTNFVTELEKLVNNAELHLTRNPQKAGVVVRIQSMTEKLGSYLGAIDEKSAPNILFLMRDIYQIVSRFPKESF